MDIPLDKPKTLYQSYEDSDKECLKFLRLKKSKIAQGRSIVYRPLFHDGMTALVAKSSTHPPSCVSTVCYLPKSSHVQRHLASS